MRAAAPTGYARPLEPMTLPDPTPPMDGAVVRVLGVRHLPERLSVWNGDRRWRMQVPFPHLLGHECVGEVAALARETRGWSVGERVVIPFHLDCGNCPQCARGQPNLCVRYTAIGFQVPGAFAEFLAAPAADRNLMRIGASADAASSRRWPRVSSPC